jgi:hypothetical protein
MAVTAWGSIVDDTINRIVGADSQAGITPTVDANQRWRRIPRARPEGESGRTRELVARRWEPVGEMQVFGGGEDQLARDLFVEVWYRETEDVEDLRHADEIDLIETLEPRSTYPSGATWALRVRRIVREEIELGEPEDGVMRVTFPVRLVWREEVNHL